LRAEWIDSASSSTMVTRSSLWTIGVPPGGSSCHSTAHPC
jgi:hypothetical protein